MKSLRILVIALAPAAAALALARPTTAPSTASDTQKTVTSSGLTIIKLSPGGGAQVGDTVRVHYTGKLTDGTKFDSSYDHPGKEPISFRLGSGGVIKGWEEGIAGMLVGEKRHLTIPPELGFRDKPREKIPPNSTIEFDIEVVGIQRE